MEVLLGPTFTIDVSPHARDQQKGEEEDQTVPSRPFLKDENGSGCLMGERPEFSFGGSSERSSSIGTPGDSEDEEEEEGEVQSKLNGGLGLGSLQDSLPIKLVSFLFRFEDFRAYE